MKAKIHKATKNPMQSGWMMKEFWLLEFLPEQKKTIDPLMGWVSCGDTQAQLRMKFATKDEAVAYATAKNIAFEVILPKPRKYIKKSYADNFKFEG